jgi:protease II
LKPKIVGVNEPNTLITTYIVTYVALISGVAISSALQRKFLSCSNNEFAIPAWQNFPKLAFIMAQVPVLDIVGEVLDEGIPWAAYEWDEWGSGQNRSTVQDILAYSPYDAMEIFERCVASATPNATLATSSEAFPVVFLSVGMNDSRVLFPEPIKYMARLRSLTSFAAPAQSKKCRSTLKQTRPIVLKAFGGGHFGSQDEKSDAEWISYLLDTVS